MDRHGFRPFVLAAGALSLVGLGVFAAAPLLFPAYPLAGFFVGTVIFSGAGGLLELLLSPIVDALPGEEKTRAMALLHSMYCWGQAGVVLVTTAALALGAPWQAIVLGWMLLPAADLALFRRAPLNHKSPEETLPIRGLARQRVFWLALGAIICGAAAEVTMAQYASSFLDLGLGIPKLFGDVAGMCGFALLMGIGRTLLGLWGDRWDLPRVLGASALLAAGCYLTAAVLPAVAVVACAATGLFVAGLWPGHAGGGFPQNAAGRGVHVRTAQRRWGSGRFAGRLAHRPWSGWSAGAGRFPADRIAGSAGRGGPVPAGGVAVLPPAAHRNRIIVSQHPRAAGFCPAAGGVDLFEKKSIMANSYKNKQFA